MWMKYEHPITYHYVGNSEKICLQDFLVILNASELQENLDYCFIVTDGGAWTVYRICH